MNQSPINIITSEVKSNPLLTDLKFTGYNTRCDGTFSSTHGHNVQFTLKTPGSAVLFNHSNEYELQQFHMHWGRKSGEGSEHCVDGRNYEVEIHFVHTKKGNTDMTEKDHFCVVAVFADVTEGASISGPWADISASLIQSFEADVSIDGFVLDKLLPENRDYYFYHGSLTTPPYSENVA